MGVHGCVSMGVGVKGCVSMGDGVHGCASLRTEGDGENTSLVLCCCSM